MTALATEQLSCGWGKTRVVDGLDITVDPGEVVLLAGANGSGKTTTMLTMAGLLQPLGGTVSIDGRPTRAPLDKRARSGLAFVPEGRAVFSRLTVEDNLRLGRGSVADALALFPELRSLCHRKAGTLSGGEQQMLRLGRALAGKPSVLLVDELSLGLAPIIVRRLLASIRTSANAGAAVIVVEQHLRLALDVADRGYVLSRGSVTLTAGAEEMRSRISEIETAYLSVADRPADSAPEAVSAGVGPVSDDHNDRSQSQ